MADDCLSFNKDVLIVKPPKSSPILPRMLLLVFAMICSFYICSVYLRQIGAHVNSRYAQVEFPERPCHGRGLQPWEDPFVHYPKPKTFSRGECECHPVRLFAILSMQRSGSGWFETLLNSHINVSSNGEIFSVHGRRSNFSAIEKTLDQVYNLDWLTSASKNECSAAVGFKWMLNQGVVTYHEEIVEYFNRRGVSVIFLFRRNLLRRLISVLANSYDRQARVLNGTHKSHVHSQDEARILAQFKPNVTTETLISDLKLVEGSTANILEYFRSTRHIILFYEDLINNCTKLMDIQDFLKVPHMKLMSRQVKIHTRPLSEQVSNWNDVSSTLTGTQYERFLHLDYKL